MIIILFVLFFFSQPKYSLAADEFSVNQTINFTVNSDKSAQVSQSTSLTNNFSQIYPKEYSLSLTGSNINITSPKTSPEFEIVKLEQTDNKTDIQLSLLRPGVGKDQLTSFTLNYTIKDFAINKGKTVEVVLPTYQNSLLPANITANITIPTSFGELSTSSVPVISSHNLGDITELKLNLTKVNRKIILVFGNHQLVDFNLKYFLKNDSEVTTSTEIAIPPDTNNQSIILKDISPQPKNIVVDPDGNWLANYNIPARAQLEVTVSGQAKIYPSRNIPVDVEVNKYLSNQLFWPVTDPQIKNVAETFTSARDSYNYVVKNLQYDYSQVNNSSRKGALFALNNPQNSICTEFSDLFVTLSRSIGIASREIEGYALSNNQKVKPTNPNSDILHSWAQYYDPNTRSWNSVDPTWENTTSGIDYFSDLDLNHLAFVIHGLRSDYPPPPGAYKNGNDIKTVLVDFSSKEEVATDSPLEINLIKGKLNIYNPNNHSLNNIQIKNKSNSWNNNIKTLPPYGKIDIVYPASNFWQNITPSNQQIKLQISTNETANIHTISLQNKDYLFNSTLLITTVIILLCSGGIILTAQKRK